MNASHYYRTPPLLTALLIAGLLLTGCLSDGDSDSGDGLRTGQFTLVGVQGVSYQTASRSGKTDSKGRFQYYPGERISFSVGDLTLIEDVPARDFLTTMDFTPDQREALRIGGVDDDGLTSHAIIEQELASSDPIAVNIMRFLMVLDQDRTVADGSNVRITQRTVDQINAFLQDEENEGFELDFSTPIIDFARIPTDDNDEVITSEANKLIRSICFRPEGDRLCEDPPTEQEIEDAAPRPEDAEDIDPDETYREDLIALRAAIEGAKRSLAGVALNRVENFLLDQATNYKLNLERPYYVIPEALEIRRGDTALKKLVVLKAGGVPDLVNLEAESKNPDAIVVHGYSHQTREVQFFATSSAGDKDKATVLINFKLAGDYRWYRKPVRIYIED